MYKSTVMLLDEFSSYRNPFGKISRQVKEGKLHILTKSVYQTDITLPGYLFSCAIYGPSYLSFDYALSRYGLIPEAVHEYTSATFNKRKKKTYTNDFGNYSYRDVPAEAFPFEQILETENGYSYLIASPAKALCDKLYTISPVKSLKEMKQLLFEDLRIDITEFTKLNKQTIKDLSVLYRSNNVRFLAQFIERYE